MKTFIFICMIILLSVNVGHGASMMTDVIEVVKECPEVICEKANTKIPGIVLLLCGLHLIFSCLVLDTQNLRSMIVFKFIPILLGVTSLYFGAAFMNWLI